MKNIKKFFIILLALTALILPQAIFADETPAYSAYAYLEEFLAANPSRAAGTEGESNAANYLAAKFAELGYTDVEQQYFSFEDSAGAAKSSQNVIATLTAENAPGTIIIGAHYDNYKVGEGANDNGSGVAVLLDTAARLFADTPKYNVVFIAFGAEEAGMMGSKHYVVQMRESQRQETLLMINIDSVAMGDNLYFFGEDIKTPLNDKMAEIANGLPYAQKAYTKPLGKGISILLPDLAYPLPYFHTGYASDNLYFRVAGIPTELIFSGTFESGLSVYTQSGDKALRNMHTANDTLAKQNELYGEKAKQNMQIVSDTLVNVLTNGAFESIILNARNEMVDEIFWQTWPAYLIYAALLAIFELFGFLYLRRLKKRDILKPKSVNTEKVFKAPDIEDIYTFLKK